MATSRWEGAALRRALRAAQGMRGVDFRASLHCGVGDPRFHLVYFPTRGLAEVSRLVLAEAAVPYTYECIGADLWTPQLKAQFTFGMLPVLANFDGRGGELCNSQVITRHIARSVGLAGTTPEEEAQVDMAYTQFVESLGYFVYEVTNADVR